MKRFYWRRRPGVCVIVCDRNGKILYERKGYSRM